MIMKCWIYIYLDVEDVEIYICRRSSLYKKDQDLEISLRSWVTIHQTVSRRMRKRESVAQDWGTNTVRRGNKQTKRRG